LEPALDVAIYQDAEMVARQLVEKGFDLGRVEGIYRRKGEKIVKNNPHRQVMNLDEYGIAAHDMIDPSLYHDPLSRRSPLTITYSQTGCVNECSYCMSQLYKPLRTRSVPHFMKELRLIKKLGFKEVFFIDCGITNNHAWAREFLDGLIAENLGLSWWGLSRADRLTEQLLSKMKEAGCHSVGVGVESANAEIISNVGKKVDLAQVLRVVGWAHRLGMRVLLYFQFGLPGETRVTMQESLDFALKSNADLVTFGIATPVPGTGFYEYIKERNLFITRDWSKFDPALAPVFSYPDLSSAEIYAFSRQAYRSFYLRPSFILRRFFEQRSLKDLRDNWENFVGLLSRTSA
jgi:anaerobic magnesium-protoporphyrin IX monomethyl ester cyclase